MDFEFMIQELKKDNLMLFESTSFLKKYINHQNKNGDTLFHLLVTYKCVKIIRKIITIDFMKCVNVSLLQNKDGNTPLHLALMNDFIIDASYGFQTTCSQLILDGVFKKLLGNVKHILEIKNKEDMTVIHLLCKD
jgi:ankyrin repeat protein